MIRIPISPLDVRTLPSGAGSIRCKPAAPFEAFELPFESGAAEAQSLLLAGAALELVLVRAGEAISIEKAHAERDWANFRSDGMAEELTRLRAEHAPCAMHQGDAPLAGSGATRTRRRWT